MPWTFVIGALVGALIIAAVFAPKIPRMPGRDPYSLDDFNLPTAEEGKVIPVLFGTVRIEDANVVWVGDFEAIDRVVTTKQRRFLRSSKRTRTVVGQWYYMAGHFVLCHGPIDGLVEIHMGEKLAWSATSPQYPEGYEGTVEEDLLNNPFTNFYIDKVELYGGNDKEGGHRGWMQIIDGRVTQFMTPGGYFASRMEGTGGIIPGFRGVVSIFMFKSYVAANSPYLKRYSFTLTRTTRTWPGFDIWNTGNAQILSGVPNKPGMNPIHIIYECLTNNQWGLGYNQSDIDSSNFLNAASTLKTEGFGLSILWSRETSLEEFIEFVCRHIEANLYVSRTTGKFTIALIRYDYNPDNLITLGPDQISSLDAYSRPSVAELINTVTVRYKEVESGENAAVTVQELALFQLQNSIVSQTIEYPGIMTRAIAERAATRDLRALSQPLLRVSFTSNRQASSLEMGKVFKFFWPEYDDTAEVIMRVTSMEFDDGKSDEIQVTAIEDSFGTPIEAIASPEEDVEWINPTQDPEPVTEKRIIEAPYYVLGLDEGFPSIDSELSDNPNRGIMIVFAGRSPRAVEARLYTSQDNSTFSADDTFGFGGFGILESGIGPDDKTITLTSTSSIVSGMVDSVAQLGDELVVVENVNMGGSSDPEQISSEIEIVIGRGTLDTTPAVHAAGTRFFIWSSAFSSDGEGYLQGDTVYAKVRAIGSSGVSDLSTTPSVDLNFNARAIRPYPPGRLRINGSAYPSTVSTSTLNLSWQHRNRKTQTSDVFDTEYQGVVSPETNTLYRIVVRKAGTVVETINDISGVSFSLDISTHLSGGPEVFSIEIYSVRTDGLVEYESWQPLWAEFTVDI